MDTYNKMTRHIDNKRESLFREYLRRRFGPRKYRITQKGEVHIHGSMPNTNETGWFLFGHYPAIAIEHVG